MLSVKVTLQFDIWTSKMATIEMGKLMGYCGVLSFRSLPVFVDEQLISYC